ncbi:MAG: trypsin-like peptidase domain-containing protein [Candidatus Bathyarchaeota archaeon]|nr:trypsin-like peptidase domain-containing protein [Candidatus Bathyarchaeota archaeon]
MATEQKLKTNGFSKFLVVVIISCLLAGGLLGSALSTIFLAQHISDLQNQVSALRSQLATSQSSTINGDITFVIGENASLSHLYHAVKDSIVVIRGLLLQYDIFRRAYYSQVQGSGFIYNYSGQNIVITNYHVVQDAVNITITFINGNSYGATVIGADPYADLAVLRTSAPESECKPLEIISSASLNVGDPVIAVGSPYGLAGSMTAGIVSALGRTITEEMSGGYPIANVIQMTAPINPGNSGGPLLNYQGQVVGITTAILSDSEGLGFAIPSSTVLRELDSLVKNGYYNNHPWIGASGTDMTYEIAKAMGVNITYGWLIAQVTADGPAARAGLRGGSRIASIAGESVTVGGDIIIAINGTRIRGIDDLSTFLEEYTLPGETIAVTVIRDNNTLTLELKLAARPQVM